VNAGNYCGMGAEYVNRLYDMVSRNLPEGFEARFICFTDDATGLNEGITAKPLPVEGLTGWWNKLALFKEGVFDNGDRVIFFDLDTVIVSKLDDIVKYDGPFAILRDFYRPGGLGSAVMAWEVSVAYHQIWDNWNCDGRPEIPGGDQAWLELFFTIDGPLRRYNTLTYNILQDLFPDNFVSYKVHAQHGIPKGARVVCFHGIPRPHHVIGNWVEKVWKVGGGSALEFDIVGNVDSSVWVQNISNSTKLPYDWITGDKIESGHAVIVGGGPSINKFAEEIAWRKSQGQKIFALNGSAKWLGKHGITPDYHVILDARPENADFITGMNCKHLLASNCDLEVFNRAGNDVLIWHPLVTGIQDLLPAERPYALIGGGGTVGLKAMALAYVMGFDEVHVYGMDSSYQDDKGHAYPQSLNEGERVIEVEYADRKFSAAPWMVTQASEFPALAADLVAKGMVVTVHGDGLLPFIASSMAMQTASSDEIVEVNGYYWPAQTGRWHIDYASVTVEDIAAILGYCRGFDVVVQAGGHIGMWPNEFSKHFKTVYTFEPDHVNFKCLTLNAKAANVIKAQGVLGSSPGMVNLTRNIDNSGASYVDGVGNIPTYRIDDLNLTACDLIQLDVEGWELNAIVGAEKTIEKFSPVIVIESNGLETRVGLQLGDTAKYIESLGYKQVHAMHRDLIFTKQQ